MYKQLRIIRMAATLLALQPCLGAALGDSASAQARGNADAQGSSDVEYEALIKVAVTEYRDGNWVEARSLFERAHEIAPSARTFRGIGLAAFGGKDYVTALGALSAALSDERKALTDEQRKSVNELLVRAQDFVAKYALTVTPSDAKVRIDSREPVMLDGSILLNPGLHELVVSAEGYEHSTRKLDVAPRDNKELRITLRPEGSPQGNAQVEPQGEQGRKWGLRDKLALGIAATGVGSLGASLYFMLGAKSKADKADCKQGICDSKADQQLNDQALSYGNVSTATAVVGVAAVGAGAILYFVRRGKSEQQKRAGLRLAPTLSASFAGATFSGSI